MKKDDYKNLISLDTFCKPIENMTRKEKTENDFKSERSIRDKKMIVSYLREGATIGAYAGIAKDVITGKAIPGEWTLKSDGVYKWSTDTIFYVENYNLKLPDDFIEHVLKQLSKE